MRIGLPRSLARRIFVVELGTILLASLLVWQVTASTFRSTVDRYRERGLIDQSAALAENVRPDGPAGWAIRLPEPIRPIYANAYYGRAYALVDGTGRILSASPTGPAGVFARAPREPRRTLFRDSAVVGISQPVRLGSEPGWVVAIIDEDRPGAVLDDVSRDFLPQFVGILFGLFALLAVANGLAIRHMVREIRAVSRHAATIGTSRLDRRLEEGNLPLEVAQLVHATNALLDRLEASFRAQTEFSGNIAHELRTPLATLTAQLDALEDMAVRNRTIAQANRLSHILSQLRDLATLESFDRRSVARLDLQDVALSVAAELAPQALEKGHDLVVDDAAPVLVDGNRVLIELALRNLIDNAIKHTPAGTRVTISASPEGSLSVADTGPGIATDELDRVTTRFWRADWKRTDSAGLGLSIVQRIMDVHGGRLHVHPRPQGACFELRFAQG